MQRRNLREAAAATANGTKKTKRSQRIRSASAGRDRRTDMQARYWAFLFENLRRAVDDLYTTCEADDSVPGTKEVILVLENYARDFRNLVDWLKLKWDYENTPPPQRPTSLAWEVRKSSPAAAKMLTPTAVAIAAQRMMMASPARRMLNFEEEDERKNVETADKEAVSIELKISQVDEKENEDPKIMGTIAEESTNTKSTSTTTDSVVNAAAKKEKKASEVGKFSATSNLRTATSSGRSVSSAKSTSSSSTVSSSSSSRTRQSAIGTKTASATAASSANSSRISSAANNAGSKISSSRSNSSSSPRTAPRNSANKKVEEGGNRKKAQESLSPKTQRTTLVARQSSVVNNTNNSKTEKSATTRNPLLSRSATTTSLRRPTTLMTAKSAGNISARAMRPTLTNNVHSTKTMVSKRASLPPFGSSSSISSSGSSRSWADTVKGLKTPRSVDNLSVAKEVGAESAPEEEDGWETVKPRTRSKHSPLSCIRGIGVGGGACRQTKIKKMHESPSSTTRSLDSENGDEIAEKRKNADVVIHSAKTRFQMPSSAMSLPTLALMKEEDTACENSLEQKQSGPSGMRSKAKSTARLHSGSDVNKNLDRVAETKGSADSLSEKKSLKKLGVSGATSEAAKKQPPSLPGSNTEKSGEKEQKSAAPKEKATNEPEKKDAQEQTVDDDDIAIAKNKEAITQVEREEAELICLIRETEQEELRSEDGESDKQSVTGPPEEDQLGFMDAAAAALSLDSKKYDKMVESLSWADQMDAEEQLATRYPGRMVHLHEKLSSPSRKKEPQEAFKKHQEKQRLAKKRRDKFQDAKASKLGVLNAKIEVVISHKEQLMAERRGLLDDKMSKAEEKRQQFLDNIRRKAHEVR
jgi:hypothetical protein